MTSTHRRNTELMQRCAQEVNTSIDRVKVRITIYSVLQYITHVHVQNWIGSEAVKRKRKAGILPRPKIEIAGVSHTGLPPLHIPPYPLHIPTIPHTPLPYPPYTYPHTPLTHTTHTPLYPIPHTQSDTMPKVIATPPTKKIKRVNGYNLFFSHVVRTRDDVGSGGCG